MKKIAVMETGFSPSPVQELCGFFSGDRCFIKREDLLPFSFGGNKVRKARLFYEEIKKEKPDVIMTYGSSSSNHCRIIANMAAAMELECHIVSPEEKYEETFNSFMVKKLGAVIEKAPLCAISETIDRRIATYKKEGKKVYFIQGGGHGNPGTAAYVECYQEIADWEESAGIKLDYIFHVSGTGTTQAGLVCGQLLAGREDLKIIGLSNARTKERGQGVIEESINNYLSSVGAEIPKEQVFNHLHFIDKYRLGGYGEYHEGVTDAIEKMLNVYGIPADTTYVGKGIWAMEQYLKEEKAEGKNILFLHTGGTPLFFEWMQKG